MLAIMHLYLDLLLKLLFLVYMLLEAMNLHPRNVFLFLQNFFNATTGKVGLDIWAKINLVNESCHHANKLFLGLLVKFCLKFDYKMKFLSCTTQLK